MVSSSLISAGASIAGGLLQNFGLNRRIRKQKELNQYVFNLNEQAAEKEYQRNLEQWNRENDYNSPVKQMERLSEAGLNPNLIYGSTDGGSAASSPNFNMPQYDGIDAPDYSSVVTTALSSATQGAALANQYAQNSFIQAQTEKVLAEVDRLKQFNIYSGDIYRNQAAQGAARVAETQANITLLEQKTNLTKEQCEKVSHDIDLVIQRAANEYVDYTYKVDSYDYRLAAIKSTLAETYARIHNLKADGVLKAAMLPKILAETRESLARAAQLESNPLGLQGESGNIARVVKAGWDFVKDELKKQFPNAPAWMVGE